MESLFRGSGRAEGLFRSGSKESLVRSPSRDSLTPLGDTDLTPVYDPSSDIESEAEDSPGNAEALSKDQLLHRLHRVEKSLANYRGKYSEVLEKVETTNWKRVADACGCSNLKCQLAVIREVVFNFFMYRILIDNSN